MNQNLCSFGPDEGVRELIRMELTPLFVQWEAPHPGIYFENLKLFLIDDHFNCMMYFVKYFLP